MATTYPGSPGAGRVVLIYALFAGAWILASDLALLASYPDTWRAVAASIAKGALFVAATSGLLYVLLRKYLSAERALLVEKEALGQHLDLLSRHANDIILLLDAEARILEANERAFEAYGLPRGKLIGSNAVALRAPDQAAGFQAAYNRILRNASGIYQTVHVRGDGSEFPVEISARCFDAGGEVRVQAIIRDVGERVGAEQRAEHLARLKDALSATNQAIVRLHSERALFETVAEIAVKRAGALGAWIGEQEPHTQQIRLVASNGLARELLGDEGIAPHAVPHDAHSLAAAAMRDGRPAYTIDYLNDPRTASRREVARERGVHSAAALPIRHGGAATRVFVAYLGGKDTLGPETMALFEEMAADVSFALDNIARNRELVETRERLELSTRGTGFGIWDWWDVRDPDRLWISPRTYELCGLRPGDDNPSVGALVSLVHAQDRPGVEAALQAAVREGVPLDGEFRIPSEHGPFRWRRLKTQAVRDASGNVTRLIGVIEDIDERVHAEQATRESEARFRAIIEQSISGICIIDANGIFLYVNPRLAVILGYARSEDVTGRPALEFVAPEDYAIAQKNIRQPITGEAQTARFSFEALRKDGTHVTLGAHGTAGTYRGARVIIATVQDVTEVKRAEDRAQHYVEQLERTTQSTIEVVSAMGEMRDPYTHGHERRVGELAAAIGQEMGLDAERVEGIRVAGYLHDIGKIGTPSEILSKPSRLSAAEFELVKQHAQQGYDILKRFDFPWPVAEIAWQHHERLDGGGYPRGLKGDEIILDARILAVADTLEAMSSHRPYRPGLGIDAALAEIERGKGVLYDSQAVDASTHLFRDKGYRLPQ